MLSWGLYAYEDFRTCICTHGRASITKYLEDLGCLAVGQMAMSHMVNVASRWVRQK